MNIASTFLGLVLNLLQWPFLNNTYYETQHRKAVPQTPIPASIGELTLLPLNLLKSIGITNCNSIVLRLGENHLRLSTLPRGFCPNCCELDIHRDIRFVFYNKLTTKGQPIKPYTAEGSALKAGINPTLNTVMFIHGFSEPSPGQSGRTIIDAYLSRPEDYNIILLDWSELVPFPWYLSAAENVQLVGKILADFIELYHRSGEIPIDSLHLIGFSLGAHVSGFAGKNLKKSGLYLPRITALDPAFPEFSLTDDQSRLCPDDAKYVDVIHTDAGVFGLPIAVGHADFFPNGGRALQPGCQPSYIVHQRLVDQILACSHLRAWKLYAESVRHRSGFPATKCKIWRGPHRQCNFTVDAFMGFGNNLKARGHFYLITNQRTPFSKSLA